MKARYKRKACGERQTTGYEFVVFEHKPNSRHSQEPIISPLGPVKGGSSSSNVVGAGADDTDGGSAVAFHPLRKEATAAKRPNNETHIYEGETNTSLLFDDSKPNEEGKEDRTSFLKRPFSNDLGESDASC